MSDKAERKRMHQRARGQGVIEYAGAICIAVVLVGLAIFVVPPNVAGMIDAITTSAMTYFTNQLPS